MLTASSIPSRLRFKAGQIVTILAFFLWIKTSFLKLVSSGARLVDDPAGFLFFTCLFAGEKMDSTGPRGAQEAIGQGFILAQKCEQGVLALDAGRAE